jgi:hypothetical protein
VRFGITSGILVISALVSGYSVSAKEFAFDYQRIVEVSDNSFLELTYVEGDLEIMGNDEGRLIIGATKRVHAVSMQEAEQVQDHIEIKVERDGDHVKVETNYLRMRNRSPSFWQKIFGLGGDESYGEVDWKISVPVGCNVAITNTAGDIFVSHLRGNLSVQTSASDVSLSSVEGDVVVKNANGDTRGDLIFGNVEVHQPRGQIDLKWIEGDVKVRSSSADITIVQESGSLAVTTSTGSVNVRTSLDTSRNLVLETESGNVSLIIPEASSGVLDIRSETGEIKTEMPIAISSMTRQQVVGEFGFGGVTVSISSISGDVTVAQY